MNPDDQANFFKNMQTLSQMYTGQNPNAGLGQVEQSNNNQIQGDDPFSNYQNTGEQIGLDTGFQTNSFQQRQPNSVDQSPRRGIAMDKEAKKRIGNRYEKELDKKNSEVAKWEKDIKEYEKKRRGIMIDTNARMDKLKDIYDDQGTNMQPLAKAIDMTAGTNNRNLYDANPQAAPQFEKKYMQGRITPQAMEMLKNKIDMQKAGQWGAMTDDATNMLRLNMQNDLARTNLQAMKNSADNKDPITPKMKQSARQDLSRNPAMKKYKNDVKLVRVLSNYRGVLRDLAGEDKIFGDDAARLKSAYAAAVVAVNRYDADLGALAGGDLTLLKQMLVPVTGFEGLMLKKTQFTTDKGAVDIIDGFVSRGTNSVHENYRDLETFYPREHGTGDILDSLKDRMGTLANSYKSKGAGSINSFKQGNTTDNLEDMTDEELRALDAAEGDS